MAKEFHVELLLSRQVIAPNGRSAGRLEEVRAEERDGELVVADYLVGEYGALERLSAWRVGRAILHAVGLGRKGGYRVRWDQLDVSDPKAPRLRCPVEELERLED
jgi:hypothetical protein